MKMITKGTQQYTQAQELANKIGRVAAYNRWNNNTLFNIYVDTFDAFLQKIAATDTFAAQVAKTVSDKIDPYGKQIAYVSDKQAWILACAAVENNIILD